MQQRILLLLEISTPSRSSEEFSFHDQITNRNFEDFHSKYLPQHLIDVTRFRLSPTFIKIAIFTFMKL